MGQNRKKNTLKLLKLHLSLTLLFLEMGPQISENSPSGIKQADKHSSKSTSKSGEANINQR